MSSGSSSSDSSISSNSSSSSLLTPHEEENNTNLDNGDDDQNSLDDYDNFGDFVMSSLDPDFDIDDNLPDSEDHTNGNRRANNIIPTTNAGEEAFEIQEETEYGVDRQTNSF